MFNRTKYRAAMGLMAVTALSAACDRDPTGNVTPPAGEAFASVDSTFASNANRRFTQVERLANPLAMEVFVEKREHGTHDASEPTRDPFHFTDDYVYFITQVAKRDEAYARAIAGALLGTPQNPGDKLTVFTNRAAGVNATNSAAAPATAVGWLSYVLNPTGGYGGRRLSDDVVDIGSAAVFGNLLGNNTNVSPGLVSDNVPANDKAFTTTFPYLAAPTM
jgi:hypothetical protein